MRRGAAPPTAEVAATSRPWPRRREEPPPSPPPTAWVEPVDGACPTGYPVKANASSRIYHVPGGQFYERTVPERCYTDPQAAEADGYRAARR